MFLIQSISLILHFLRVLPFLVFCDPPLIFRVSAGSGKILSHSTNLSSMLRFDSFNLDLMLFIETISLILDCCCVLPTLVFCEPLLIFRVNAGSGKILPHTINLSCMLRFDSLNFLHVVGLHVVNSLLLIL